MRNIFEFFLICFEHNFIMKKFICLLVVFVGIVCGALFMPKQKTDCDYLRLHIRANSNSNIDQSVKYEIKDELVKFLTPHLCNVESKEKAIAYVEEYRRRGFLASNDLWILDIMLDDKSGFDLFSECRKRYHSDEVCYARHCE